MLAFILILVYVGVIGFLWYDHFKFWREFGFYGGKKNRSKDK